MRIRKSWIAGDIAYLSSFGGLLEPRWVAVVLLPLAALAVGMAVPMMQRGHFFLKPGFAVWLPLVVAFAAWAQMMERHYPIRFRLSYQPLLGALAAACFTAGALLPRHRQGLILAGVLLSLLSFLRLRDLWACARLSPGAALIAGFAACCAKLYYAFSREFWELMCRHSALLVEKMLWLTTIDVQVRARIGRPIIVKSDDFTLRIFKPCSGLEGIFLFYFLLCLVLLIDWKLFVGRRWWLYFVVGGFYMFFFNGLRIVSLFVLGHWAWQPDATPFQISLRGQPLEIFHSFVGWTYYLIAFSLFTSVIYRHASRAPRA